MNYINYFYNSSINQLKTLYNLYSNIVFYFSKNFILHCKISLSFNAISLACRSI